MGAARVAARALNQEQVLAKFIAKLFDFKIAHARIVQKPTVPSPSSSPKPRTLYKGTRMFGSKRTLARIACAMVAGVNI